MCVCVCAPARAVMVPLGLAGDTGVSGGCQLLTLVLESKLASSGRVLSVAFAPAPLSVPREPG